MSGFKTGSSDDNPFDEADDADGVGDSDSERVEETPQESESATESQTQSRDVSRGGEEPPSSAGGPWVALRNSITDGREKTVQLHLQQETLDAQRDAKAAVEKLLGESVKKADLREAAIVVGYRHQEEVADELRGWGYDYEFYG